MTRFSIPQNGSSSHTDNTKVSIHLLAKSNAFEKLKLFLLTLKLLEELSQQSVLLENEIERFQFLLQGNSQSTKNADWSQQFADCSTDLLGRLHIMQLMTLHILSNLGELQSGIFMIAIPQD